MSQIKLRIDVKDGTVEIEADAESFGDVMERAEGILDKFASIERPIDNTNDAEENKLDDTDKTSATNDQGKDSKPKRRRTAGGGKVANWKMIDDLLDEQQRSALKEFFAEKKPSNQNEQVAVLLFKLKELTGRDRFDGNEIHTAVQIVGKKTPGNLTAVFGNMATLGLGSQVDKKFVPNFKTDDLVKHDLPPKGKEK